MFDSPATKSVWAPPVGPRGRCDERITNLDVDLDLEVFVAGENLQNFTLSGTVQVQDQVQVQICKGEAG